MSSSLITAFVGGLQASVAVLLTISYGAAAAQFRILSEASAKDISRLCVKIFLPALLATSVGSQLKSESIWAYMLVLAWSTFYTLASMGIGSAATRFFGFPNWVTPAASFNNSNSLPLVLLQSLESTGVLSKLLKGPDDSTSQAFQRARSYFLVCSVVSNALTFAVGPKLLGENVIPNDEDDDADTEDEEEEEEEQAADPERGGEANGAADEHTSLLPDSVNRGVDRVAKKSRIHGRRQWKKLPRTLQDLLSWLYVFMVSPVVGAAAGAVIGLTPPLRRIFFNSSADGGVLNGWLTLSVKNVGDLFPPLQLVVVGSKLSKSLRLMKANKESGTVPWRPAMFVFAIRFVFWPLISIPLMWALATKTKILGNDPILWFCLMFMPTGPPAARLSALADIGDTEEHQKLSIAKFLTIAYAISPVLCFSVVGALKASEAAVNQVK